MSIPDRERLRSIKTFPSLVKYLRDELEWPIESANFDDLTFDYQPEELGLDADTAVKIKEIKQLRPLITNQPWGIFFINFEPKSLPVVVLRRILRSLVLKKRQSANKAQQATWKLHDLLFISSYGESDHRDITFAHFSEDPDTSDLPALRVLGWDDENTVAHLEHAHKTLKEKLRWPENPSDINKWRATWSQAFILRNREVITTAKGLAVHMAQLATAIRKRVNKILAIESVRGPLRKLHAAFKEALIHDLSEDDFADMYAQTITYGLLSARVSRPAGLVADNITDMAQGTNPFLGDLLSTFLTVGGRKGKIDFDELGINEVVQALRDAKMEAILRDFGDKNPQEDPVIHFYELFLKEYDPKKRMQRGVFYTPRPVVSFIVRSVDELLRTEFGLADGLADITTWGEMVKRQPDLKIPKGAKSDDPFVQILDPATGTGTFLVEAIDVIQKTMNAKWQKQGKAGKEIDLLWNQYVAEHLLPRLFGFELMMAPYAIAHMKIGLKLHDTGYDFASHERACIYLTNSLEEPQDFSDRFEFDAPALAHEAHAVNAIKEHKRFTVVIGNPPYAGHSANKGEWISNMVDDYYFIDGEPLGERTSKWLQDDYVKFFRLAQQVVLAAGSGVIGYITNHGYLDNPTFRGMRSALLKVFPSIRVLDLHGSLKKKEKAPDGGKDENVFEIQPGVSIALFSRSIGAGQLVSHADLFGSRVSKYRWLAAGSLETTEWHAYQPAAPFFILYPQSSTLRDEYAAFWKTTDIFPLNGVGMTTARDHVVIDFDREPLLKRAVTFRDSTSSDKNLCKELEIPLKQGWNVSAARRLIQGESDLKQFICGVAYRPFDDRFIFYHDSLVWRTVKKVMRHMLAGNNLGLAVGRAGQVIDQGEWNLLYVTRKITEFNLYRRGGNNLAPLYTYGNGDLLSHKGKRSPNLSPAFLKAIADALAVAVTKLHSLPNGMTPEDIFNYTYSVFQAPGYRSRYAEFLKIDFPRLPLTGNLELFRTLARLGGELVALHLMESPRLDKHLTKFIGSGRSEVEKISYSDKTVCIDKEQTQGFRGIPENVWNFHIGGYQVCEKWLKDRKGRTLSKDDIEHYHRIVVALHETIRLMSEIDMVIDAHGGWPHAFLSSTTGKLEEEDLPIAAEKQAKYGQRQIPPSELL